jgi:hypothetical protein
LQRLDSGTCNVIYLAPQFNGLPGFLTCFP